MTDPETTIDQLKAAVRAFSRERDWEQFHHPKDLGVALACEVGELLEHFRYRTHEEIAAHLADPEAHRALAYELADCLWLVLRLGDVCDVDLASALREKLAEAARKYPVDLARGRADKYTRYQQADSPRLTQDARIPTGGEPSPGRPPADQGTDPPPARGDEPGRSTSE